MSRKFTHEQKLQYLKDGYVFVRSGKGFYKTYIAAKIGVSRTTYYRWMQKHADEAGIPASGKEIIKPVIEVYRRACRGGPGLPI